MKYLLIVLLVLIAVSADAKSLDVRCTKQIMTVNGVSKDVHVSLTSDYKTSRYILNVYTKPANSPSRRSKPVPADPVKFSDFISIMSSHGNENMMKTDDRQNGYDMVTVGDLFPSTLKDPCSSSVIVTLKSVGSPSLKVNGSFDCSAVCDW